MTADRKWALTSALVLGFGVFTVVLGVLLHDPFGVVVGVLLILARLARMLHRKENR